jgi:hypothetical protein
MTNVAVLDIEMRAKTSTFDRNVTQAGNKVQQFGKRAKMARAETSKMEAGFRRASNAVAILDGPFGGVSSRLSGVAAGFATVGVAGTAAGLAIAAAGAVIGKGVGVLAETERQLLRTEALLKSTGNASGQTVRVLDQQARAVALATLASTEGIRDAQAVLLTFKSVGGETFNRTIRLAQDMAAVINTDAKSAVMQLGKALEDPTKGLTALTKAGVSFTEAEKNKIKALAESGGLLKAQTILLDKIAGQFGGAAQKEAEGYAGAVDTLGHRFSDLAESLARVTGASSFTQRAMNGWSEIFKRLNEATMPDKVEDLFGRRIELLGELGKAQDHLGEFGDFKSLPDLPIPGVLDKGDWRDAQYEVTRLNKEIAKIDKLMQGQIGANDKIISQEKEAYDKMIKHREEMERQAKEAKKLAELEERRLKAQKESLQLAKSRGAKGTSLYSKLFAEDEKEPKNYTRNFNFESEAKSAKKFIDSGSTLAAEQFIDRAQASYVASKNYGWASNYDLQGMKDVVLLLREQAGLDYKDPDKDSRTSGPADSKEGGKSLLEVTRENGDKLTLVSESSAEMTKKVEEYLEVQRQAIQGASKQSGPTKKFVLELAVPGKNKNLSITAETKDEFESSIANLLEGAASGL